MISFPPEPHCMSKAYTGLSYNCIKAVSIGSAGSSHSIPLITEYDNIANLVPGVVMSIPIRPRSKIND